MCITKFIICVDAAHLKSCYKGTIYIYSGLTGNEEAYVLAFGIRRGNEDFVSWDIFNMLFAETCPCVGIVEEGHIDSKYIFVSDQDKGLDKSLETFSKQPCNKLCPSHKRECQDKIWS